MVATGSGASWEQLAPAITQLAEGKSQTEWAIPLELGGRPLDQTAAGAYDAQWSQLGDQLTTLPQRPVVTLSSVSTATDPAQAKAAYRRAADLIRRSVDAKKGKVTVAWQAPVGATPGQLEAMWPGDDLVDVVTVIVPPGGQWADIQAQLDATSDWAAGHGKRIAIKWGVTKTTSQDRIDDLRAWIDLSATQKRIALVATTVPHDLAYAKRQWKVEW